MGRKSTYTVNQDIREYMEDHGVSQRALAAKCGVTVTTINNRLKVELSQKDKEIYLNMIDTLANQRLAEQECIEEAQETADVSVCTKFQIGDRVKIPSKQDVFGEVSDIWSSLALDRTMYEVTLESNGNKGLYAENQLEPAHIPTSYSFEAHIDGNIAVVTMQATQDEKTWICARGHAHIIHDGEAGMAQAISYAAKRMFESLDKQQENKIYFK